MSDNIKVKFKGTEYWIIGDLSDGALAPLNHCYEDGNIINPLADSFAHLFPSGNILRWGDIIGTINDLEIINEKTNPS